jgi:L-threonylcarbamoyladenylate synthase
MEILTKTELRLRYQEILEKISEGAVFIYPTDTIYGIGCNAKNKKSIERIRQLKGRSTAPFSIIVPSKEWIQENCKVNKKVKSWVDELPGPLTLIMNMKEDSIADNIAPEIDTIGIRLPDHWFTQIVEKLGFPIITTSANKTGQPFMTSIEDLDQEIQNGVEFMIYEGPKEGKPSKIINIKKSEIKER